jgi:hypothetical protein
MSFLDAILIILLAVSVTLGIAVFFYYKFRRSDPREKFAVRVFGFCGALVSTYITVLLFGHSSTSRFASLLFKISGNSSATYEPSVSDKILAVS